MVYYTFAIQNFSPYGVGNYYCFLDFYEGDELFSRKLKNSWNISEQIADSDSYVYLAAINALAELAYWKQQFFDEMVEFFLDPAEKLKSMLEFNSIFFFFFL